MIKAVGRLSQIRWLVD